MSMPASDWRRTTWRLPGAGWHRIFGDRQHLRGPGRTGSPLLPGAGADYRRGLSECDRYWFSWIRLLAPNNPTGLISDHNLRQYGTRTPNWPRSTDSLVGTTFEAFVREKYRDRTRTTSATAGTTGRRWRRSWNTARKHLEDAIVLAQAAEREFCEISEDVRKGIEALDLVVSMAEELDGKEPAPRRLTEKKPDPLPMLTEKSSSETEAGEQKKTPVQMPKTESTPYQFDGFVHTSSRPLFLSTQPTKYARLSILQEGSTPAD